MTIAMETAGGMTILIRFAKIAQLFIQLLTKSQILCGYELSITILSKWSLTILFDVFLRTLIPHSNVAMATFFSLLFSKIIPLYEYQ